MTYGSSSRCPLVRHSPLTPAPDHSLNAARGLQRSCLHTTFCRQSVLLQASVSAPAGEQEKPAENLEEVHAATARSGSQAAAARNGHLEVGGAAEAAVGPALPVEEEPEPLVGPVLPSEKAEVEDDPYNLPVSHLVALEGMASLKRHPSDATAKLAEDSNPQWSGLRRRALCAH